MKLLINLYFIFLENNSSSSNIAVNYKLNLTHTNILNIQFNL